MRPRFPCRPIAGRLVLALAAVTFAAAAAAASAVAAPAACPASPTGEQAGLLSPTELLRASSLDLRGTTPTMADYDATLQAIDPLAHVGSVVGGWLASPEFADQVVRQHRDKLWNSLENLRLMHVPGGLAKTGNVYWRNGGNVAIVRRGNRVACLDEPATWDDDGNIVFKPQADGTKREGWVLVKPYWAPATEIKVCATDAIDTAVAPSGKSCAEQGTTYELACGCGPNLRWCRYGTTDLQILRSFATALERQVREMILEDRPYTDLLTEKVAWINGPIAFYWKHQAQLSAPLRMTPTPIDVASLPNLAFTDEDTWVKVDLPKAHAGILTSPAFLLRFQTNRARGSRFYNSFLCQPFQAPDTGIPVDAAAALAEPDLQKRAGCKYCHALLEPVASFWGRWVANGAAHLDPVTYPPYRNDCDTCAKSGQLCSPECKLFYKTVAFSEPEKAFFGWLEPYVFLQTPHQKNVDQGPKLMALAAVVDQRLPRCAARRTAEWLLGREVEGDEELAWIDELSVAFVQGGFSYRKLVSAIVTSDVYRRVR